VVICLAHANFGKVEIDGLRIRAVGGREAKGGRGGGQAQRFERCGILEGIPGNIGGGAADERRRDGGETFNAVEAVRVMDFAGNIRELKPAEMSVTYRCCATLKEHIALSAVFIVRGAAARGDRAADEGLQREALEFAAGRAERGLHVLRTRPASRRGSSSRNWA